MNISLEQQQELITQIANNLTGNFITASNGAVSNQSFFGQSVSGESLLCSLQIGDKKLFTFTECGCPVFNRQSNDFRRNLESYLHNFVVNHYDIKQTIHLINIGGDWTGLTIILAKLYLSGYRNINLAVLDDAPDYNEKKIAYMNFWVELFLTDFKITYDVYFINDRRVNKNICDTWFFKINPLFYTNTNLLVFAEDVGSSIQANNSAVENFVTAVKQARIYNFNMVQSSNNCHSSSNRHLRKLHDFVNSAINRREFEQKIFFITSIPFDRTEFRTSCSTLTIQQDVSKKWQIVDDTQVLKLVSDEKSISQSAAIFTSTKKPKIAENSLLLFSNIASSSSSSPNTITTGTSSFNVQLVDGLNSRVTVSSQEQQDLVLAKRLQEEADHEFALSLQF